MVKQFQTCRVLSFLVAALLVACSPGTSAPSNQDQSVPTFTIPAGTQDWQEVVPARMPDGITSFVSNNNLDIAIYENELFLAYRTAPSHFAGTDTVIHVVRSSDIETHQQWELDLTIATGKDIREPRLLVIDNQLFLYVTELGTDTIAFEPGRVFALARNAQGDWTEPQDIFVDGTLVWRTKFRLGRGFMSAYKGGENIYQGRDEASALEEFLLSSDDGWNWTHINPDKPALLTGGISEMGYEFDAVGNFWAVLRNEAGDESGFGSRLCKAPAEQLSDWTCTDQSDPNKYDSPFMFRWRDELYLIARYAYEPYDLNPDQPATHDRFLENQVHYSTTTKRTALYGYNTETFTIELIEVLPSSGDTAFASGVWLDEDRLLVMNYSSPLTQPDQAWIEGQIRGSNIYSAIFDFSKARKEN